MKTLKAKLTAGLFAIFSLVAFSYSASAVISQTCANNTAPTAVTCPSGLEAPCCFTLIDGQRTDYFRAL